MKKFTEKQILAGFKTWEQSRRDNPKRFMTCYEEFQQSVDESAAGCVKALMEYIEKANK